LNQSSNINVQVATDSKLAKTINVQDQILSITPHGLTFVKPVTLSIPYSGEIPPVIVSFDSTNNKYSVLPVTSIDKVNKKINVLTYHFSEFGKYVVDTSTIATTPEIYNSNFDISVDRFQIGNNTATDLAGTAVQNSGGACWGFAAFSKWYYETKKTSDGFLRGKFGCNEKNVVSDAFSTQNSITKIAFTLDEILGMIDPDKMDEYNFNSIAAAIKVTGHPQIIGLGSLLSLDRHAVLATNITGPSQSLKHRFDL